MKLSTHIALFLISIFLINNTITVYAETTATTDGNYIPVPAYIRTVTCPNCHSEKITPVANHVYVDTKVQKPVDGTTLEKGGIVYYSFKVKETKDGYNIDWSVKNNENKIVSVVFGFDAVQTKDNIAYKLFCMHPSESNQRKDIKCLNALFVRPLDLKDSSLNGDGINSYFFTILKKDLNLESLPDGEYQINMAAWRWLEKEQVEECKKQTWSNNGELCDCIGVRTSGDQTDRDKFLATEKYCGTKIEQYRYFYKDNVGKITLTKKTSEKTSAGTNTYPLPQKTVDFLKSVGIDVISSLKEKATNCEYKSETIQCKGEVKSSGATAGKGCTDKIKEALTQVRWPSGCSDAEAKQVVIGSEKQYICSDVCSGLVSSGKAIPKIHEIPCIDKTENEVVGSYKCTSGQWSTTTSGTGGGSADKYAACKEDQINVTTKVSTTCQCGNDANIAEAEKDYCCRNKAGGLFEATSRCDSWGLTLQGSSNTGTPAQTTTCAVGSTSNLKRMCDGVTVEPSQYWCGNGKVKLVLPC